MLAVVVLAVLATVQVECAPNQLWPTFDKVSVQPTKKPIFVSTVNKETQSKHVDPSATQHAYEQFINTWLRQASLTLNRPDLLKLVTSTLSNNPTAEPSVVDSVVSPVVVEEPAIPVEEIVSVAAGPLFAEPEISPEAVGKQWNPVPIEQTFEAAPLVVEPVEAFPEIAEVVSDVTPLVEELLTPVAEQLPSPIAEKVPVFPLAEDVTVTPVVEVVAEPIPSFVEQDTATVLIAPPPTSFATPELIPEIVFEAAPEPLVEAQPLELLQPVAESQIVVEPSPKKAEPETVTRTGKSFSSVKSAVNVIPQVPVVSPQVIPQVVSPQVIPQSSFAPFPTFAAAVPAAPLPAFHRPGAVTTNGLAYTLQFFPRRSGSHYFISTPIGG